MSESIATPQGDGTYEVTCKHCGEHITTARTERALYWAASASVRHECKKE